MVESSWGRERERVIGEYVVGKEIGRGSFSSVWQARHRVDGTQVAIKEISLSTLNNKLTQSLLSEISILKNIIHPNIIRLHNVLHQVPGKIYLVLEYCSGGDLSMHIQRHGRVTEPTAKQFMHQLAAGLKVLRDNNIIHRDLKPQNLLLSTNDGNAILKIADFGFARSLQPRGLAETLCGSPLYMAPEIMQLQKYGAKADLWSVGVILYQLVTGKTPFTGSNQIQLLQNIMKATELYFPPDIEGMSSDFVDLCQKLLRHNPVERLMFDEFFNHPFLHQKQLNETFGGDASFRNSDSSSTECNLLKTREESGPDDGLPFILDDDSSGPDGSPSFSKRRSFIKSSSGFPIESRKVVCSTMRHVDQNFNEDNQTPSHKNIENSAICMEQRRVNSHLKALDYREFNDQDYVIVPGPPLDVPYSHKPKPSLPSTISELMFPASSSIESKPGVPVPIIGYPIGSFDSQSSAAPGSMDTVDILDQPCSDTITRLKSLQDFAAVVKELVYEMVETGRLVEAFSIQLVILAILKQAVHICHTQAISTVDGCISLDIAMSRVNINKIKNGYDLRQSLHGACSQVLENVSNVIKRDFFSEVEHAEELSKFVGPGSVELPDAMETIYQSALTLGRNGAVDELMGDIKSASASYSRAVRLLIFLLVEAPSLILNPPFNLTNSDRFRLRNYINILNDRQEISRSQRLALLKTDPKDG